MRPRLSLFLLSIVAALPLAGQAGGRDPSPFPGTEVRTFQLRHLHPKDAAQLVAPYVLPGLVFEAGASARAITVRGSSDVLATIDSVLSHYDQPPQSVTLRFQLIRSAAEASTDPRLRGIESTLRELFSFAGYRMVGEGVAVVGDNGGYGLTLTGDGRRFSIRGDVGLISRGDQPSVRVRLDMMATSTTSPDSVSAASMLAMMPFASILSTQITLRIGTLTVLGSGTEGTGDGALILLVRPELR